MPKTYPRVIFGGTTFDEDDFVSARLVDEFSPLSITLPSSQLEFSLFSTDTDFSIINPSGAFQSLSTYQPVALYVVVDGQPQYLGQFFLDEWDSQNETVKRFLCIDLLGLLDKTTYRGGLWLSPVTVGELFASVLDPLDLDYQVDPDVASSTLTGWLPIMSCREALQQIGFAAGCYVLTARQPAIVVGKLSQVAVQTSGARCGVARAGQSRAYQVRWRPTQSALFVSGNAVTRGLACGVPRAGQSRVWSKRWRPSQWEGIKPIVEIPSSQQARRTVSLRPQVTGVELIAHDIVAATGSLDLLDQSMPAGVHEVQFSQPVHTLSVTGATITESGANYAILTVAAAGPVTLSGKVYAVSDRLYAAYLPAVVGQKENVVSITDATLVTSNNGESICRGVFDYYQQRYQQRMRLLSPSQYVGVGSTVDLETLYGNRLYGVVERMVTDLFSGNMADVDVVGIIK